MVKKMQHIDKYEKLSPIQEGLFYDCLANSLIAPLYLVQNIIHVDFKIDISKFCRTVHHIINQIPQLKYSFHQKNDTFIKKSHSYVNVSIQEIREFNIKDDLYQTESFTTFLKEDLQQPFDLNIPGLMRFYLAPSKYQTLIIWTRHHILMDGTASALLFKKILAHYFDDELHCFQNISSEKKTDIQAIPFDSVYWKTLLNKHIGCALKINSTTERRMLETEEITLTLTESLYKQIKIFKKQINFSTNSLLIAIWSLCMYHYTSSQRVTLGTVRSFLPMTQESPIGIHINILPVICEIEPNDTIITYLDKLSHQFTKIREQASISSLQLKKFFNLPIDSKLYDTVIDYKPFSFESILKNAFPQYNFYIKSATNTPFAWSLKFIQHYESLVIKTEYDKSLYDDNFVNIVLEHFLFLLDYISKHPEKCIKDLLKVTLENTSFKKYIPSEHTTEFMPYNDNNIMRKFHQIVKNFPQNIAAKDDNKKITYQELDEKANYLAGYLQTLQITPNSTVGVSLKNGIEVIILIVAFFKIGVVYLPIDPELPALRIKHYINKSQITFLISNKQFSSYLNSIIPNVQLLLMEELQNTASFLKENTIKSTNLTNLYCLYTSGSTSLPKPVVVDGSALYNLIEASRKLFNLDENQKILQFSALSFDASLWEIFMSLLSGCCLIITNHKKRIEINYLQNLITTEKITTMLLPPNIFNQLNLLNVNSMQNIIIGGDTVNKIHTNYPSHCQLFNAYGTTETTICTTVKKIKINCNISIGTPIKNNSVYILDENDNSLPIHVYGNIAIGGVGVCKNYRNQNNLYYTGDIGRRLANGEIEFYSRHQRIVKINSLRIGLNEIESTLSKYPLIKEAAVITTKNPSIQIQAVIVCKENINTALLENFLLNSLPKYMLPNQIHIVDYLPYTIHQKIDYKALESIYDTNLANNIHKNIIIEIDDIAKTVIFILKKLTKTTILYEEDDLFALGLRSLEIVTFCAYVNDKLNIELSVPIVSKYRQVTSLLNHIRKLVTTDKALQFT